MFLKNRFLLCALVSVILNLAAVSWLGLSVSKEPVAATPKEIELRLIKVYQPPKPSLGSKAKLSKAKPKAASSGTAKTAQQKRLPKSEAPIPKPSAKKIATAVKTSMPPAGQKTPSVPGKQAPMVSLVSPPVKKARLPSVVRKPRTTQTAQITPKKSETVSPKTLPSQQDHHQTQVASTGKPNGADHGNPGTDTGNPTDAAGSNADQPTGDEGTQTASNNTGSPTGDPKSADAQLAEAMAQAARDNEQKLLHSGHYQPPTSAPQDQTSNQGKGNAAPSPAPTPVAASAPQSTKPSPTKTSSQGQQEKAAPLAQQTVPPKLPMGYTPSDLQSAAGNQPTTDDEVKNTGVTPSLPGNPSATTASIKTEPGIGAPATLSDMDVATNVIGEPSLAMPFIGSHSTRGTISDPPLPPRPEPLGLMGEYFAGDNFQQYIFKRVDADIQFDWSMMRPDARLPEHAPYSVRWNGHITPKYSETYTFYTAADDGVRLWIDGKPLIDNWTIHATVENSATIALETNHRYDIRVEFFEKNGMSMSTIKLYWESAHQIKEYIPGSQLSHVEPAVLP